MLETQDFNTALFILLALALVLIVGVFVKAKNKQFQNDQLQQELDKKGYEFNQLLSKFEQMQGLKNQAEQALIKAQSYVEAVQIRLEERDNQLKESQNQFAKQLIEKESLLQRTSHELQAHKLELTELKTTLASREESLLVQQQNFEQSKQQMTQEFQNLANRILEEKSQKFSQSNQLALNSLLTPFREQIEGFQKRVNEIHSESVKGNAGLEAEIKKVLNIGLAMSQEANNLTSALKGNKKTLGNWGEMQLEQALQLAGLVQGEHYKAQDHFKDEQGKHFYPDFVVYLPDGKHLIIDSKMSLNAYEQAVNADNGLLRETALQDHIKAVRNHINELSQKDYSNLIGMRSPNFVLMFVALEPAYIEAMKADVELFNYGYNKNVILVSYTTLMPILRTVANLWRIERGNAEAREISEKAGEIYNQICTVAERLDKLGSALTTVSNHYNKTVTALVGNQGLAGKVERFKKLSNKANKTLPEVTLLDNHIETEKLLVLKVENESSEI